MPRLVNAAHVAFVALYDLGPDGLPARDTPSEGLLMTRVAGTGLVQPLPAADEIKASRSLLRSGRPLVSSAAL